MQTNKTFLLLGVGGSGMSSLGHILLDRNDSVIGYDKKQSTQTQELIQRGMVIYNTLDDAILNAPSDSFIVFSTAISQSILNEKSKNKNFHFLHRSELLHQLFSEKESISIAGSHGKTTTTAMVSQILQEAEMDPSIMVGGDVPILGMRGGYWGQGRFGVYESDESDGTFLNHQAILRIITNIDNDHLDFYKTKSNLLEAFSKYAYQGSNFKTVLYLGDKGIQEILQKNLNFQNTIVVGTESDFEDLFNLTKFQKSDFYKSYLIKKEGSFWQFNDGVSFHSIQLPYLGDHYSLNGSLAIATCLELSIPISSILKTLKKYQGVKRRLEVLGYFGESKIIDDYGHHPTEVKAVIASINQEKISSNLKKSIVIFQPHRFTRTSLFFKEFAESLLGADIIFLLPIYSAGEESIDHINTELIYNILKENNKNVTLLDNDREKGCRMILDELNEPSIVLTLGAGDVFKWGLDLVKLNEKI
jgi:UDP-N-acetylmuramate--alanine ligase